MTALISTAYMEEALRFDRVSLMHEGQFLASGTPDDLVKLVPGVMVELRCLRQIEALTVLREHYAQVEPRGVWVSLLSIPRSPRKRPRGGSRVARPPATYGNARMGSRS